MLGNAPPELALLPAPGAPQPLQLLLANPEHAHLVDLLQRNRLEAVLAQLQRYARRHHHRLPPLTEVADALPLADVVDTILVSVRLGRSRRDKLEQLRRGSSPSAASLPRGSGRHEPAGGYNAPPTATNTGAWSGSRLSVEELEGAPARTVEVGPGE